jgi:hypothetical protein
MKRLSVLMLLFWLMPFGATAQVPTTTGSIPKPFDMSISMVGAPGDGNAALVDAIRKALAGYGVRLADQPSRRPYKLEGKITMGQPEDGRQPLTILWTVTNPKGKKRGTVIQKNEVPAGSLDGAWGPTADQAAGAAAAGVVKLLPAD